MLTSLDFFLPKKLPGNTVHTEEDTLDTIRLEVERRVSSPLNMKNDENFYEGNDMGWRAQVGFILNLRD